MSQPLFARLCLLLLFVTLPKVQAAGAPCPQPCPQPGPSAVQPLFWKVSSPSGTAYLLGSIHFGKPEMYPLPAQVMQAYARSGALVVEADILAADPERVAQWLAAKAIYQDGSTLQQKLPPETWRRLAEAADQLQLPVQLLERQKPWFVSMSLSVLALQRNGYDDGLGIDKHFLQAAAEDKKKVIELESIQQQLALFDAFSDQEQAAMLAQTLDDIARGSEFLSDIMGAWRTGADTRLDALLNDELRKDAGGQRIYRVLLLDRNVAMSDKVAKLMRDGGTYFVVVGAGHLVGEQGIVSLLRGRGYRIERL